MTEHAALCAALEEALAESRARYEAEKDDAYRSYVYVSKTETLADLLRKTRDGMSADELAQQARKMLPELEEAMREEDEHPTFDWDNEHYYYLLYEGQRDAWRVVQRILENGCRTQTEEKRK